MDLEQLKKMQEQVQKAAEAKPAEAPPTQDPPRQTGWNEQDATPGSGEPFALAKSLIATESRDDAELVAYQRACDDLVLAKGLALGAEKPISDEQLLAGPLGMRQRRAIARLAQSDSMMLQKAMDTATASEGLEWMPESFSQNWIDTIRIQLKVGAIHEHFTMPRSPFRQPVSGADADARLIPESTTDSIFSAGIIPMITPGTASSTFTAKTLGAGVVVSEELDADSIVATVQFSRSKLTTSLSRGIETGALNGGASHGTHFDADTAADPNLATRAEKAFDGYRYLAQAAAKIDAANAALSLSKLRDAMEAMGELGGEPEDLVVIVGIKGHRQAKDIPEILTMDKVGPQASVMRGQVGEIDGSAVIVSPKIRENLNASGVQDGVTTNRTITVVVNKKAFQYGDRTKPMFKVVEAPITGQRVVILKQRLDLQPVVYSTTTLYPVALVINQAT
jgi:HK97 family phage major capsid protein